MALSLGSGHPLLLLLGGMSTSVGVGADVTSLEEQISVQGVGPLVGTGLSFGLYVGGAFDLASGDLTFAEMGVFSSMAITAAFGIGLATAAGTATAGFMDEWSTAGAKEDMKLWDHMMCLDYHRMTRKRLSIAKKARDRFRAAAESLRHLLGGGAPTGSSGNAPDLGKIDWSKVIP